MPTDPYRGFHFNLIIEGVSAGHFVECDGLGTDIDVIAYREGGANSEIRHLPGQTRYRPMTLRYGLTQSSELWDWFQSLQGGEPQRRNISVVLFDNDGTTEALRWNLFNAWVSGWRAAPLDANRSEVAIETMTIVYDRLERD